MPLSSDQAARDRHPLFDWLLVGQVVPWNPPAAVRGPTHVVERGKTPVLQPGEVRLLLDSISSAVRS